ncbi:hypothetical protein M422DRAFT_68349 [Sphaerobolus stellatus SS14]|uniref:Protein kinase domain-containing protein n=1 Tax=Sphaerobolus stellatus (strain SS14) TaxID=990650 RepID=A0A0C9VSI0_SPHS4|nr:hypothetical protein M422DRAFT_68349 [Sphaerobolus stellatus SS14]
MLFRNEIAIWASLKHPNVLELFGASSATGDPPWFFVSPYMKNGTAVSFLKARTAERGRGRKAYPGPLQMMREIAVGMSYLHRKGVLHGDLKAANVLIDDDFHCVISDFGQSQLRSEVYRLSQKPRPRMCFLSSFVDLTDMVVVVVVVVDGTLRWQSPEIMSGESTLTPQADVYAFAIVCVEILTNGELPWPMLDDQNVQVLVLRHNKRPKIPLRPETSLALVSLIEQCWSTSPLNRPLFEEVARGLGHLIGGLSGQRSMSVGASPSPRGRVEELIRQKEHQRSSPDLAPVDLPDVPPEALGQDAWENLSSDHLPPKSSSTLGLSTTPPGPRRPPLPSSSIPLQRIITPNDTQSRPHSRAPSRAPSEHYMGDSPTSVRSSTHGTSSEPDTYSFVNDSPSSPLPREPEVAARRDERRYRLLLQHDFHPSLNLPLWEPTPVPIGAVGYLSKPDGRFTTLFNALAPPSVTTKDKRRQAFPSIYGYGSVHEVRQDSKRGIVDIISGFLTFRKTGIPDGMFSRSVRKRYSYPLRAGHKHAYLCTENTTYRYMENIDAAKAWFKGNIKEILKRYGTQHEVHREDVFLVIGTLETRDYGLFVSHEHPDGQVHFNIYADRQLDQDWGIFSTDFDVAAASVPGPDYHDGEGQGPNSVHATKISKVKPIGGETKADVVLLTRLRFKPDEEEPTRL